MCLYEKVDHHGTIISQNAPKCTFPSSNLKIFPVEAPRIPPMGGGHPHPIPFPPPRQWRVEGAEAPYYITLTATQFHSPST